MFAAFLAIVIGSFNFEYSRSQNYEQCISEKSKSEFCKELIDIFDGIEYASYNGSPRPEKVYSCKQIKKNIFECKDRPYKENK